MNMEVGFNRRYQSLQASEVDQCELCGKEFTGKNRRNNLVRHIKTHSGEKPFHCPACEYKASRKEHMIRHLRKGSCIYQKLRNSSTTSLGQPVQPTDVEVMAAIEECLSHFGPSRRKTTSNMGTVSLHSSSPVQSTPIISLDNTVDLKSLVYDKKYPLLHSSILQSHPNLNSLF